MDSKELQALFDKLTEAREAGYGNLIDDVWEMEKSYDPNPVMLMKELEDLVQRVKTVKGDFNPHWLQDMNSRIDALAGEVNDIFYASTM